MEPDEKKGWIALCERAADSEDPIELEAVIEEIITVLELKVARIAIVLNADNVLPFRRVS